MRSLRTTLPQFIYYEHTCMRGSLVKNAQHSSRILSSQARRTYKNTYEM